MNVSKIKVALVLVVGLVVTYALFTGIVQRKEPKIGESHPQWGANYVYAEALKDYIPRPHIVSPRQVDITIPGEYVVFEEKLANYTDLQVVNPNGSVESLGVEAGTGSWTLANDCSLLMLTDRDPYNGSRFTGLHLKTGKLFYSAVGGQGYDMWYSPKFSADNKRIAAVYANQEVRGVVVFNFTDEYGVTKLSSRSNNFYLSDLTWSHTNSYRLAMLVEPQNGSRPGAYVGMDTRTGVEWLIGESLPEEFVSTRNGVQMEAMGFGNVFGQECSVR